MKKTRYEGVLYKINRRGAKVFYARFKVNNKAYLRKIGEEPNINAVTASNLRFKMIDEIRSGVTQTKETIGDKFDQYIKLRSPSLSASWEYNMTKTYNKHLKDVVGELHTGDLESHTIQSIINDLLAKGYAVSTVKQIKDCISGLYKHTLKDYYNIANDITLPKFDNQVYFTITETEAKKLYEVITNYEIVMWRVYFSFLLHGRRRTETALMKWENLNINDGTYEIEAKNSKTGKRMNAPMLPFLTDMLNEYQGDSGYIFTGRYGDKVSKSGIDYHWTRIKERAGLPKMRLHDLRHLMGYIAINNGFSLEEIAHVLGHSSTATTRRYSNMSRDTAKRTLEAIHDKLK